MNNDAKYSDTSRALKIMTQGVGGFNSIIEGAYIKFPALSTRVATRGIHLACTGTPANNTTGLYINGINDSGWAISSNGGNVMFKDAIVTQKYSILTPNNNEPSKTAGTLWASGTAGVLYYMSTNNGTWKKVNLT
jgi:hypothetical protein